MDITTERLYTVYMHTSPSGKRYVGITRTKLAHRWGGNGQGYKDNSYFWNAITKYGWSVIAHEILATGLTKDAAESMEIELIERFDLTNHANGYNLMPGGGAKSSPSQETRAKISAAKKGRTLTAEHREAISAAGKGKQNALGYEHTAAARAAISAAQMGRKATDASRAANKAAHRLSAKDVECLTVNGAVIGHYSSLVDAEEKTGVGKQNIWKVCSGKRAIAGGFRWRYA